MNSPRGARAVFSFQLIILLEQFALLESKKERFIYIKISPSPSSQDSSLCVDTVDINCGGSRGMGWPCCPAPPTKRQTRNVQSVYCSQRRYLPYRC